MWAERESRRIGKARTLIGEGIPGTGGVWADAGCGNGIFTSALYTAIQPGGLIYAIDRNRYALDALSRNFAESYPEASLHLLNSDFTGPLDLPPLAGLLMANSLHFVDDKRPIVGQLVKLLQPGGRLIVVEYNTVQGNMAVPHPIDESEFLRLAASVGLQAPRILARIPSTFLREMYSGIGFAP